MTRDVRTHVRPHVPVRDRDVPADHQGVVRCRCGLPIVDGDPRHTPEDVPDVARAAAHDEEVRG